MLPLEFTILGPPVSHQTKNKVKLSEWKQYIRTWSSLHWGIGPPTKVAVATFVRSKQTAALPPTKTILEASEDVGVNIEYSCRIGTCGICKVKLLSGTVTMEVQDALEPADKQQNIILACQAIATGDVSVDA